MLVSLNDTFYLRLVCVIILNISRGKEITRPFEEYKAATS